MLLLFAAIALQPAAPASTELLCKTNTPGGRTAQTLFTIDEAAKTFIAKLKDGPIYNGTAELTPDTITLVDSSNGAISTMRISRKSGHEEVSLGSASGTGGVVRFDGKCKKYTGPGF